MKQLKKTLLTLVALLAVTTGAWAAKVSKIGIGDAYYQKIGSDYKIIVTGYVMDADDGDIDKGKVYIYLNDEQKGYCDAEFGQFSGEVDVAPGSYYVRVRYHDDSGDYDDSQDEYYDNPITINPPEPVTWYVDGSKPYGNDGKSKETAFSTLNEALYAASNNDTVKIAAGTYTGSANIGPYIQKILTFEKYGDGEAIFDGQGQGTIWSVGVNTINIYGLTFINGGDYYGGALYFLRDLSNSVINATFKDNSVSIYGGAIYVGNSVSNLTLQSTFINNHADEYGGAVYIKSTASNLILNSTFNGNTADNRGAGVYIGGNADNVKVYGEYRNNAASQGGVIYANKAFSSSVIDATFIDNTAKNLGGAFCFNGDLTGVDISGKFLNNTGGDCMIYVANSVSGNSIQNSVFLNNEAYKIINVYNGEITAKDNWFGNDDSNYYKIPEDVGIDLENWLFLKATADPSELAADETSTIIFKLSSFDGSEKVDYDASKMNVVLELSQTLGELNKNTTSIGEEVIYTAKQEGKASVTGKVGNVENVEYTIPITVNAASSGPEVAWDKAEKTGSFTMPGGNVTLEPEYYPQAVLTAAPTAINDVPATTDGAIVEAGTVATIGESTNAQGTVMYYVSQTALDDAALLALNADLWTADVPTAESLAEGQAYVYYYVRGNDGDTDETTFSDGDILATNALTVTIAAEPTYAVTFNAANANTIEAGKATVTVGGTAAEVKEGKLTGVKMGSEVKLEAKPGYKFRKVEVKNNEKKLTIGDITLDITGCTTWQQVADKNSTLIKAQSGMIWNASTSKNLKKGDSYVRPDDLVDPTATDYQFVVGRS